MFIFSLLISISRTFFYAFYDFKSNILNTSVVKVVVEILKGIFSSLFNYSSLRIFRSFADDDHLSLAQGIFNTTNSALSFVGFAILGFFLINYVDNNSDDIRRLFKVVATISCFGLIAPIFIIFYNRKKKGKTNRAHVTGINPSERESS